MTSPDKPKILIVDDISANLIALDVLLRNVDAEVIQTGSGNDALSQALHHEFAFLSRVKLIVADRTR